MAGRATVDEPQAAYVTRVVCEVTDEAPGGSTVSKIAEALPDDIAALVTAGSAN